MEIQRQNRSENERRQLIYLQDDQSYCTTPFLFKTNCNWPISKLEKLSLEPPGAGRFSTSFGTFKRLLNKKGYSCKLVKQYRDNAKPPEGFDIVKGATGNY